MTKRETTALATGLLTLLAAFALPSIFPAATWGQEDREMRRDEDNYNKLLAMRVWLIIDALDLDISSEKGQAMIDAIKKYADGRRDLTTQLHTIVHELRDAMAEGRPVVESEVALLIQKYDDVTQKLRDMYVEEAQVIKNLLTPLERAKLLLAEESFKWRLRHAMGSGKKGRGKVPGEQYPQFEF